MTAPRRHAALGVEYVEVEDEPNHVERFHNEYVRLYVATIPPGKSTLFHRHREDTLYLVLAGGISRSEDVVGHRQPTRLGRSIRIHTKLAWALRRLVFGTVDLPRSTVVMRYHRRSPLVHRLIAQSSNAEPLCMLGIELLRRPGHTDGIPLDIRGFALEYRDELVSVHRIALAAGQTTGLRRIGPPGLLVIVTGHASLHRESGAAPSVALVPGAAEWLGSDARVALAAEGDEPLQAFLITLR